MHGSRLLTCKVALNTLYFAVAAAATIFVVSEAWHYGFFFTPFPAILTALALLFVSASVVGVSLTVSGPAKVLPLIGLAGMYTTAAIYGSHFSSFDSIKEMLGYFLVILTVVGTLVAVGGLMYGAAEQLPTSCMNKIRCLALLLPIPIIAYAGLSLAVNFFHMDCPVAQGLNSSYVRLERVLFGPKRADQHCLYLFRRCSREGHYSIAERYALLGIDNARDLPLFCADPISLQQMLADRYRDLATVLVRQNRSSDAMDAFYLSANQEVAVQRAKHVQHPGPCDHIYEGKYELVVQHGPSTVYLGCYPLTNVREYGLACSGPSH